VWDFGDNSKNYRTNVRHCFPGPGRYSIKLDLIDRKTGTLFFRKLEYDVEIFDIDQPYINSSDVAVAGETVKLDGLKSFCPGYTITGYFWDFGDGTKGSGERVSHKFIKSGDFNVRLGLTLKSQTTGDIVKRVVSKKIKVFGGGQERTLSLAGNPVVKQRLTDISQIENIRVNRQYSAENKFMQEAVFQVVLLSSSTRKDLESTFFKKVPEKYSVKEIFDTETRLYSYIVDQQMTLMAAYPAYSEMVNLGYKDAVVRIFVLKEPVEKELYLIKKNYILLADTFFDGSNRLTTNAYIMLDQVVTLLNKYPVIRLEIGVHTDNQGVPSNNLSLSNFQAQVIVDYLINRGISSIRLTAKGYGSTRPVASNILEKDRKLNRRVDFIILNK
jgi:outer membrane protein OmpA-like peptidoglycan-associated protein